MLLKKFLRALLLFATLIPASVSAQTLPAEKLVPREVAILVTIPDFEKVQSVYDTTAQFQLFQDPAMKPFVTKFMTKLTTEIIEPLEKELGVQLKDYKTLFKGQMSLAVTPPKTGPGSETNTPEFVIMLDSKTQKDLLKSRLDEAKTKWQTSGRDLKPEKVHNLDFTTIFITAGDIRKVMSKLRRNADEKEEQEIETTDSEKKFAITIGQSDSLLLIGNAPRLMEKIIIRQGGGSIPTVSELASFEASYNQQFREAHAWVWINPKPFIEMFTRNKSNQESSTDFLPSNSKMLEAVGLQHLQSLAFSARNVPAGTYIQFQAAIPESQRQGLFKIFNLDKTDASPPPFVPQDSVKFQRIRINLSQAWNNLESLATTISPQAAGAFKLIFESAGKDKDPNFDLRRELFGNLGNDLITYEKNPRGTSLVELQTPPTLILIGSPNSDKLLNAIKVLTATLGNSGQGKDREVAGKKIYTLPTPGQQGKGGMNLTASGGYLAISADISLLEEFLRSAENKPRSLSQTTGMPEAAQEVGGMNLGMFGFNNPAEEVKFLFETLKKDPDFLSNSFSMNPLAGKTKNESSKLKEWFDFNLLPPYEQVGKYFHFGVYSGNYDSQGFTFKGFSPTPPQLKK